MGFTLPVPGPCAATRARHVLSILSLRMHFRIPIRVLRARHPKKGIVTMSPSYILHEWNIELSMAPWLCYQNGPELSMTSSLWESLVIFWPNPKPFLLCGGQVSKPRSLILSLMRFQYSAMPTFLVASRCSVSMDLLNLWDVCVCACLIIVHSDFKIACECLWYCIGTYIGIKYKYCYINLHISARMY